MVLDRIPATYGWNAPLKMLGEREPNPEPASNPPPRSTPGPIQEGVETRCSGRRQMGSVGAEAHCGDSSAHRQPTAEHFSLLLVLPTQLSRKAPLDGLGRRREWRFGLDEGDVHDRERSIDPRAARRTDHPGDADRVPVGGATRQQGSGFRHQLLRGAVGSHVERSRSDARRNHPKPAPRRRRSRCGSGGATPGRGGHRPLRDHRPEAPVHPAPGS